MLVSRGHMRVRFRSDWILPALILGTIGALSALGHQSSSLSLPAPSSPALNERASPPLPNEPAATLLHVDVVRTLPNPSETPAQLTCQQARSVAAQARDNLAQPPPRVDPRRFAESAADWLDPHGLWSVAPDSPVRPILEKKAAALLNALIDPSGTSACIAAKAVGCVLAEWIDSLRDVFDRSYRTATGLRDPVSAAVLPLLEDDSILSTARVSASSLATEIGARIAALKPFGPVAIEIHNATRQRVFPTLSDDTWGNVVLAAALRAYVLLIDPHGAWAPFDEETALYDVELEASGRYHLWGSMTRTAAGARINSKPVAPLQTDDVVLSIDGIPTAGLSVEQIEQLAVLDPNDASPLRSVMLLRRGAALPIRVRVNSDSLSACSGGAMAPIPVDRVKYRNGRVVVITLHEVPDGLGVALANALADARLEAEPEGVVLDLRGNGGGSTEGAKEALGAFLPGANLFPMRRRGGAIEIEQAPVPAFTDTWHGPVAAIVDAETASAAEMIAGAIAAYKRGIVLGTRTFGKGSAQEYLEDYAGIGMLRLSTLLYALPNGFPVQKVGLQPDMLLDLPNSTQRPVEREDSLHNAMLPWTGPDVRTPDLARSVSWPPHEGKVGPCEDEVVCKALARLGAQKSVASGRRATKSAARL